MPAQIIRPTPGQIMKPTPKMDGIVPIEIVPGSFQQKYSVPIIQTMPLDDGSGDTADVVVGTLETTISEQQSIIDWSTTEQEVIQERIDNAQAVIDGINALPLVAIPPVTQG